MHTVPEQGQVHEKGVSVPQRGDLRMGVSLSSLCVVIGWAHPGSQAGLGMGAWL